MSRWLQAPWWPALLLALACVAAPVFLAPGPGYLHDLGLRLLVGRCYMHGAWPLWNAYEVAGRPLLADPHAGALFPGNLPYWVLPPAWAQGAAVGLACATAAAGGGAAYGLALLLGMQHLATLQLAALLPWGPRLARRGGPWLALWAALVGLVGPPAAGALVLAIAAFAGGRRTALPLLLGLGLAAPQWLPTLDWLPHTAGWPEVHTASDLAELAGAAGAALVLAVLPARAQGALAAVLLAAVVWSLPARCPALPTPLATNHELFDGTGRALGAGTDGVALREPPWEALTGTRLVDGVLDPISPAIATLLDAAPGCTSRPGPGFWAGQAPTLLALRRLRLSPELAATPRWQARLIPPGWRVLPAGHGVVTALVQPPGRHAWRVERATTSTPRDPRAEVLLAAPPPGPFTPGGASARFTGANQLRVLSRGRGPGLVVIAEGYDPGWRASLRDGMHRRELPLMPADGALMACVVPAGSVTVDLAYMPRTWWAAWAIAAASAFLLAFWWRP